MSWPEPLQPPASRGAGRAARGLRVGWDVGGAHVKACLLEDGAVRDVRQWACPLWQGLAELDAALERARRAWPAAWDAGTRHVATMTGEMVDLFPTREDGVARLAAHLAERLGPSLLLYAGEAGWVAPAHARGHWPAIASANWRATAQALASRQPEALLADVGSTTTDLVPVAGGRVAARGSDDAARLATGELVYHGVARTPLCALAPRVRFGDAEVNVMNEFFATTADVYRLTGELDPAHDLHPAADRAGKDRHATCQRLARMIGRDARDAPPQAWLAFARTWREAQLATLEGELRRVLAHVPLAADAPLVAAGCGAFLVPALAARVQRPCLDIAAALGIDAADAEVARGIGVAAPAVAVALLAQGG